MSNNDPMVALEGVLNVELCEIESSKTSLGSDFFLLKHYSVTRTYSMDVLLFQPLWLNLISCPPVVWPSHILNQPNFGARFHSSTGEIGAVTIDWVSGKIVLMLNDQIMGMGFDPLSTSVIHVREILRSFTKMK